MSKRGTPVSTIETNRKPPLTTKSLESISLEKAWPVLSPELLAFTELEQDELYPYIKAELIPTYIEKSIQYGQQVAGSYTKPYNFRELINLLLKQGVRVRFLQQPPLNQWVRARYTKKPAMIEIYRSSIEQIGQFFSEMKEPVSEEELYRLHLFHEWFHHLEETKYGRTDLLLPRVKLKSWGPFISKKPIYKTREIAAHSFTQTALGLQWSPLLLDQILLFIQQGWTKTQIREHFRQIKQKYEQFTKNLTGTEEENGIEDEKKADP
jgi:hypothetical protein